MKTGKPEVIGNMNKNAILALLRKEGPLSRAEIVRRLNISFPSVSSNVKALIESGLVLEIGESERNNGPGRKSTLLSYNASKGYVIGVDAGRSQIRAMCSDLLGTPVASVNKDSSYQNSGEYIFEQILSAITDLINMSEISENNLKCICIGIPGIWDEEKGKNRLAPFIHSWEDIRVKDRLESKFGTEVIVDNSVNLGAIGEKWQGIAQGHKDIVFIDYGVGIGAGIILNNELYRGRNNAAGEIGYMALDKFYLRRSFKEEGALEELISGASIINSMKSFSSMKSLSNNKRDYSVEEIFKMADESNILAKKVLNDMLIYLSIAIVNIVSVINPDIIVLSGRLGTAIGERYRQEIMDILEAHVPYVPDLVISELGDNAPVIGAIAVAIRYANSNLMFAEQL